jgi:hypothetical protein
VLIMMTLTALGSVAPSISLGLSSGVLGLLVAALVISGLGVAAAVITPALRASGDHRGGRLLSPIAPHALPA